MKYTEEELKLILNKLRENAQECPKLATVSAVCAGPIVKKPNENDVICKKDCSCLHEKFQKKTKSNFALERMPLIAECCFVA